MIGRRRTKKKVITLQRLEEMLIFAAKLRDLKGPIAQPILERCEREYLAAKLREQSKGETELDRVRKLIGASA